MEAPDATLVVAVADMIGDVFLDRELTQDHLDTMIYPALDALEQLETNMAAASMSSPSSAASTFPAFPAPTALSI